MDSELNAHEVWDFDIESKSQTLVDIIALCPACHGVTHFRNSERIGYGNSAKRHFMRINNCNSLAFAKHYADAQYLFEQRNQVLRWNINADLSKFGGEGIEVKKFQLPFVLSLYTSVNLYDMEHNTLKTEHYLCPPKIREVKVNNYQGTIKVVGDFINRAEWYLDDELFATKYNVAGRFISVFSVKDIQGSKVHFKLIGNGGEITSKEFGLEELNC